MTRIPSPAPPLPRLPGESPCSFALGLDGWATCIVHGWSGGREQRRRVLVCPEINTAPALDLADVRAALLVLPPPDGFDAYAEAVHRRLIEAIG